MTAPAELVHHTVIRGGRVIDPASGRDEVGNIGITDGRIAAISAAPLRGRTVIDASGLVVTPGFIDLHSHSQTVIGGRLQAFDGVTTALELEAGALPVDVAYRRCAAEGRPINYGFSASWAATRMFVLGGIAPTGSLEPILSHLGTDPWRGGATPDQTVAILERLEAELAQGALGVGLLLGYAPLVDPAEFVMVARVAAASDVPTFTHARPLIEQDQATPADGAEEIVRAAAETGAHMHYCHVNSTSGRQLDRVQLLLDRARGEGGSISTEVYPYGAGMSAIGADYFRPDRLHLLGATGTPRDVIYASTGEIPGTVERLEELRAADPGGLAFIKTLDEHADAARLAEIATLPGAVIASDAMPLVPPPGGLVDPEAWPPPPGATTHPRTVGSFCRALRIGVRESGRLSLSEALARASWHPAEILSSAVPAMARKGRLQVGCDADIIAFDPHTVSDRATYQDTVRTSTGMRWVLVNGQPVIADGEIVLGARPGRPVRR